MQTLRENIIEILLKSKHMQLPQLEKALAIQKEKQIPLRRVLVSEGIISEVELLSLLSEQLFIPSLHLAKYKLDLEIIKLVPEHMARQYNIIPLSRIGSTLTVAMSDPLNIFALDDLKVFTGCNIDTVFSSEEEITQAIDTHYRLGTKDMQQILEESSFTQAGIEKKDVELLKQEEIDLTDVIKESEKPPIVKLVDLMLSQALNKRASDIHIEPEKDCLRIRYRVDGSLHDSQNESKCYFSQD